MVCSQVFSFSISFDFLVSAFRWCASSAKRTILFFSKSLSSIVFSCGSLILLESPWIVSKNISIFLLPRLPEKLVTFLMKTFCSTPFSLGRIILFLLNKYFQKFFVVKPFLAWSKICTLDTKKINFLYHLVYRYKIQHAITSVFPVPVAILNRSCRHFSRSLFSKKKINVFTAISWYGRNVLSSARFFVMYSGSGFSKKFCKSGFFFNFSERKFCKISATLDLLFFAIEFCS